MASSNKTTSDFITGVRNREIVETNFNTLAIEKASPVRIRRYHPDIKLMLASEKARYNTQRNRQTNEDPDKAMGLDYEMYSIYKDPKFNKKEEPKILHIRFSDGGGYWIKIPSDRLQDPEAYLYEIKDSTWVVFVWKGKHGIKPLYSNVTPLSQFLHLPHQLSEAEGNKNRMVFSYGMDGIHFLPAEASRGFIGNPTLQQIEFIVAAI